MTREDIEFAGEGEVTLRGWFYPAQGATGPAPAVVMCHGITAVKEMHLEDFAHFFAAAGLNVVLYDHRNFGSSDGEPRQEMDPVMQYRDIRNAITYTITRPEVDESRIGIWGTSFAGGHVLQVAAIDKRVKAVVSQVPFTSGSKVLGATIRPDFASFVREQFHGDRLNRYAGNDPAYMPAVTPDPTQPAMMGATEAYEWFTSTAAEQAPSWKNELTARSLEMASEYEPGWYAHLISPTPLLMLIAKNDVVTPYKFAFETFQDALEPKALKVLEGGHFDAYNGAGFDVAATAARDHFVEHLGA
jgi:dienelactone hydrolase